jgi:hypothetical protein
MIWRWSCRRSCTSKLLCLIHLPFKLPNHITCLHLLIILFEVWTSVGWFSLFVKTVGSSSHNHFKEPLRFSFKKKKKKIYITFKGFKFLEKNIPNSFQSCQFWSKLQASVFNDGSHKPVFEIKKFQNIFYYLIWCEISIKIQKNYVSKLLAKHEKNIIFFLIIFNFISFKFTLKFL